MAGAWHLAHSTALHGTARALQSACVRSVKSVDGGAGKAPQSPSGTCRVRGRRCYGTFIAFCLGNGLDFLIYPARYVACALRRIRGSQKGNPTLRSSSEGPPFSCPTVQPRSNSPLVKLRTSFTLSRHAEHRAAERKMQNARARRCLLCLLCRLPRGPRHE